MVQVLELIEANCEDCPVGVVGVPGVTENTFGLPNWLLILIGASAVGGIVYMAMNRNKRGR